MKTKLHFLLFVLAVMFLQIGCGTPSVNSQTKVITSGDVIVKKYRPEDEAQIVDKFTEVKWNGQNKDDLMQIRAPQIFMAFQCSTNEINCVDGKLRQELSADAQKLVDDY